MKKKNENQILKKIHSYAPHEWFKKIFYIFIFPLSLFVGVGFI